MSDQALENVKRDAKALQRAFMDAGGTIGDGHHHNACPFCKDDTGFMLGTGGTKGNAVFKCFRPGCKAGGKADAPVAGTIVDFLMLAHGIDSKAACVMAKEKYGQPGVSGSARTSQASGTGGQGGGAATGTTGTSAPAAALPAGAKPYDPSGGQIQREKKGKLHMTVDLAIDAAKYSITARKKDGKDVYARVELFRSWKYTDERGDSKISVARFNTVKATTNKAGKQFVPVHRDGNGWRVGLGDWGKGGKLCPLYNLPAIAKTLKAAGRI